MVLDMINITKFVKKKNIIKFNGKKKRKIYNF